jgi:predicted metal-dependent hydrolase
VIVPDLVHHRQFDRSPKFWAKMVALMPDYKRRREWLPGENEWLLRI